MKNNKFQNKRIKKALSLLLLLAITIMPGCSSNNNYISDSANGIYFDTLISITIYDKNMELISTNLQSCIDICEKYEKLFNSNIEGSDIYKLNTSEGKTVKLSEETIYLLDKSIEYSKLSSGLFDVTIKKATNLWDFHEEDGQIPSQNLIDEALKHINYHNISIDNTNKTVTLLDKECQIDIGGIAKGYIADQIAEYLNSQNIHGAIINIGGDITIIGHKNENDNFNIGITDPFGGNTPIIALSASDKAIATSGTYERAFTYNNKQYHHILDPLTGYPIDTNVVSATTITNKGIDADTLCTISILLGAQEAINLIQQIPDTEAIIICDNHEILYTQGAQQYIRK